MTKYTHNGSNSTAISESRKAESKAEDRRLTVIVLSRLSSASLSTLLPTDDPGSRAAWTGREGQKARRTNAPTPNCSDSADGSVSVFHSSSYGSDHSVAEVDHCISSRRTRRANIFEKGQTKAPYADLANAYTSSVDTAQKIKWRKIGRTQEDQAGRVSCGGKESEKGKGDSENKRSRCPYDR